MTRSTLIDPVGSSSFVDRSSSADSPVEARLGGGRDPQSTSCPPRTQARVRYSLGGPELPTIPQMEVRSKSESNKGLENSAPCTTRATPAGCDPPRSSDSSRRSPRGSSTTPSRCGPGSRTPSASPTPPPGVKDLLHRIGASYHKVSGFFLEGRPRRSRGSSSGSTGGTSVRPGRRPAATSWMPATRSGAWSCSTAAGCWSGSGSTWASAAAASG